MARLTNTNAYLGGVEGVWNGGSLQRGVDSGVIVKQTWTNPASYSQTVPTGVHNATLTSTYTSATTPSGTLSATYPRNLVMRLDGGTDTPVITVTGKDGWGNVVTESFTLSGTTVITGNVAFKSVTTIQSDSTSTDDLQIGFGNKLGLMHPIGSDLPVLFEGMDNQRLFSEVKIRTKSADSGSLSSGSTYDYTNFIPAGSIVLALRGRIITGVAGGTDLDLGVKSVDADCFIDGLTTYTAGTTFGTSDSDYNTKTPTAYTEAMPMVYDTAQTVTLTANSGTFSAGDVRLELIYIDVSDALDSSVGYIATAGTVVAGSSAANADDRGTYTPSVAPNGTHDYSLYYIASTIGSQSA